MKPPCAPAQGILTIFQEVRPRGNSPNQSCVSTQDIPTKAGRFSLTIELILHSVIQSLFLDLIVLPTKSISKTISSEVLKAIVIAKEYSICIKHRPDTSLRAKQNLI